MQFLKFAFVGGAVALLHLALVFVLTQWLGLWYLFSTVLSYLCALVVNFLAQKYFVYRETGAGRMRAQAAGFAGLALLQLALNTAAMFVLVSLLYWHYVVAQAVVICLLAGLTYHVNRNYIFGG